MKLIIQVPCYNEEEALPVTLSRLPRQVTGFDLVEWLVVDDGSTDATASIARSFGVDHIVRHNTNRGLARAFMTGIQASLACGADVIVNTDADNQYNADDIPTLIKPIFENRAEMVIGERPFCSMPRFTPVSRLLHAIGCLVVRFASGTDTPDAPSGFRAFTRNVAGRLIVFDTYTYTLETIIQAGRMHFKLVSVPIRVNEKIRPSRLISSTASYVLRSVLTIVRTFALYRPYHFFFSIGAGILLAGLVVSFLSYVGALLLAAAGGTCLLLPFLVELTPQRRRIREEMNSHGHAVQGGQRS